jgi:hypothetical protein
VTTGKRGYSRAFPLVDDTGQRYLLDDVPSPLWAAVRAKCRREHLSVRAAILLLLQAWVAAPPRPVPEAPTTTATPRRYSAPQ